MKKFSLLIMLILLRFVVYAQLGIITTVAGGATTGSDNGPALLTDLSSPAAIAFDSAGNYYFCEVTNVIKKVSTSGIVSTFAGNGDNAFSGDGGPATAAAIHRPYFIAVKPNGDVYFADGLNYRIRKVDAFGVITTVAGNGSIGYSGDGGPATSATFSLPFGICVDRIGNVYVSDQNNYCIRKIDNSGIITTYAGTGTFGVSTDGGLADTTRLGLVSGICVDTNDNLYITDGNKVRKIDATTHIISAYAGSGATGTGGDGGPAVSAQFMALEAITFDKTNSLYIADLFGQNVRKVDALGIVYRVAGTDTIGYSGDGGIGTGARLHDPEGLAVDRCGNLFIADLGNNRIRKVTFNVADSATIAITGVTTATTGSVVTLSAALTDTGASYSIQWYNNGILFATTTTPFVSYTKGPGNDTITAIVVPAGGCNHPGTAAAHVVSSGSVGIIDAATAYNLVNIYPNPATSTILISSNEGISSATVLDLMGREVAAAHLTARQKQVAVNIAALPAGVYIVKADGVYVSKLLKE